MRWQWHQLDHMETICTSFQTDNHNNISSLMLFLMPNQKCLMRSDKWALKILVADKETMKSGHWLGCVH